MKKRIHFFFAFCAIFLSVHVYASPEYINNAGSVTEIDSSGTIRAILESGSMVEGSLGLHFVEVNTDKRYDFYYFDFNPEELGLISYKPIEGSAFSEIVVNPDLEGAVMTLYWQTEERYVDLADERMEVMVLKKVVVDE